MQLSKAKKIYKDWKWTIFLILICIIGIPLTTILGIQSPNWGNDFWPNALSEFLGMFVDLIFGALFTLIVIDKYTQYHKNKQWEKIKNITYKNLYFLLSDILLKLNLSFPKEMRIKSYILTEDIETLNDYLPKADFEIFANFLIEKLDNEIRQKTDSNKSLTSMDSFENEEIYNAFSKFKQHSKIDITTLSATTIPKLLNFSDDIELLDDLIELEELLTSLLSKIKTVKHESTNHNNHIKLSWILKLQQIIEKIKNISSKITQEIDID